MYWVAHGWPYVFRLYIYNGQGSSFHYTNIMLIYDEAYNEEDAGTWATKLHPDK